METVIFYLLSVVLFVSILWAGARILTKAGLDSRLVLCLLIPVVNILMIWVFAFCNWPNVKSDNDLP